MIQITGINDSYYLVYISDTGIFVNSRRNINHIYTRDYSISVSVYFITLYNNHTTIVLYLNSITSNMLLLYLLLKLQSFRCQIINEKHIIIPVLEVVVRTTMMIAKYYWGRYNKNNTLKNKY